MGGITQLLGNLLHAAGGAIAEQLFHLLLQIKDRRCRLLAGLHTRLVIGVDIHQFAIKANGTLKQSDQGAKGGGIELTQGQRHALAAALREG